MARAGAPAATPAAGQASWAACTAKAAVRGWLEPDRAGLG